jgi:hypothetical protein
MKAVERSGLTILLAVLTSIFALASVLAADPPKSEDELQREAAIAEFTRKTKAANYPALFEQAAQEFKVPVDVLKGVAFAETRWEHLVWPPGETTSPETGKPRPFGIMSLWDNKYFGHSLMEAAQLIGQDPDVLKSDPLQNMRGAAALLRKLYNETPRPEGTTEADIESWRYAVRKYCGIPEPDLNARHALDIYTFISKGYHQFGIEWDARPVNLQPIREETSRIVAEEAAKRAARPSSNAALPAVTPPQLSASSKSEAEMRAQRILPPPQVQTADSGKNQTQPSSAWSRSDIWWFLGGALVALGAYRAFLGRRR